MSSRDSAIDDWGAEVEELKMGLSSDNSDNGSYFDLVTMLFIAGESVEEEEGGGDRGGSSKRSRRFVWTACAVMGVAW